jgi:hypothetical protein
MAGGKPIPHAELIAKINNKLYSCGCEELSVDLQNRLLDRDKNQIGECKIEPDPAKKDWVLVSVRGTDGDISLNFNVQIKF